MGFNLLVPVGIILAGMVCLVIYILAVCVKQLCNQLTRINEELLVLISTSTDSGNRVDATRALVSMAHNPKGSIGGVTKTNKEPASAKEQEKIKPGFVMGVR